MSKEDILEGRILGRCESIIEVAKSVKRSIEKGDDLNHLGEFQDMMFKCDIDIARLQTIRDVREQDAELERMNKE